MASAVVAVAALYFVFSRIPPGSLAEALRIPNRGWLVASVVSVLVTLSLVAVRWGALIGGARGAFERRVVFNSVVLGQAVNILVPLRFGEATRVVYIARRLDRPAPRVVAAATLERAMDVAAFGAAVIGLLAAGWLPESVAAGAPTAVLVAVLTIAALVGLFAILPKVSAMRRHRGEARLRIEQWIDAQAQAVQAGWSDATRWRNIAVPAILTVCILLASAATNFLVMQAFALAVPVAAALALLVVLQIGTAVVSVPGNIGVFHYLTVLTLAQWQVPAPQALATGIVLHAISIGPKLLLAPLALLDKPSHA